MTRSTRSSYLQSTVTSALLAGALLTLSACGGGGGGGDGAERNRRANEQVNVGRAVFSASKVVAASLKGNQNARSDESDRLQFTQTESSTFPCELGGSASSTTVITIPDEVFFQEVVTDIPFFVSAQTRLNECEGLSGTLNFDIDGVLSDDDNFVYVAVLNASLGAFDPNAGNCRFTFSNVTLRADSRRPANDTVGGTVGAVCDAGQVTCVFDDVRIGDESDLNGNCF